MLNHLWLTLPVGFTAIILNVNLIVAIKIDKALIIPLKRIQTFKTILIIAAVVVCLPLTVYDVITPTPRALFILLRDTADGILLHTSPACFLAVAVTRLQVIRCRGMAAILMRNNYVLVTVCLALMPQVLCTVLRMSLALHRMSTSLDRNSTSEARSVTDLAAIVDKPVFVVLTTAMTMVIPFLISFAIYVLIVAKFLKSPSDKPDTIFYRSYRISRRSIGNMATQKLRLYRTTLALAMTLTALPWVIYAVLELLSNLHTADFPSAVPLYCKLAIVLLHPFGEGILLPDKRDHLFCIVLFKAVRRYFRGTEPLSAGDIHLGVVSMTSTGVNNDAVGANGGLGIKRGRLANVESDKVMTAPKSDHVTFGCRFSSSRDIGTGNSSAVLTPEGRGTVPPLSRDSPRVVPRASKATYSSIVTVCHALAESAMTPLSISGCAQSDAEWNPAATCSTSPARCVKQQSPVASLESVDRAMGSSRTRNSSERDCGRETTKRSRILTVTESDP